MTLHIINCEDWLWAPDKFHSVAGAPIIWKQTPRGILVHGEESERRTRGEPTTLRRIWGQYGNVLRSVVDGVMDLPRPCLQEFFPLVLAVIAAESRGDPTAERHEPSRHDYSIGLTQVLTATAQDLARTAPEKLRTRVVQLADIAAEKTIPKGGSLERWRSLLQEPHNAIALAVWYLLRASSGLQFDPVLCYAAYNAGSARENASTPWGLNYYRKVDNHGKVVADAMDSFVKWYGDACHVYLNP